MPETEPPSLPSLLILLGDRLREAMFEAVSKEGLLPPAAVALRMLDEPLTMRELATRLSCDPSFITQIADALEQGGLAERRADLTDRRVKRLEMTAKGRRVRERISRTLVDHVGSIDALDAREQRELRRLLSKVLDATA